MTEQEWREEFAHRLRVFIVRNNYNQKILAEVSGVTESAISNYIKGKRMPDAKTLYKLSEALCCSSDELINPNISIK